MKYSKELQETFDTLKDFQQATVNHVVDRISEGQKKFLIADEVGLGKTIVAKGVIAKLYEKEYNENKNFNIIYICSNLALVGQNLSKLSPFRNVPDSQIIDHNDSDDRLTSLAYKPQINDNEYKLKIRAFTPTTSFDNKTNAGKADERVLLYRLLETYDEFKYRKTALKWFLKGGRRIREENWCFRIAAVHDPNQKHLLRPIRNDIYDKFYERLQTPLSIHNQSRIFENEYEEKTLLDALLYLLEERKQNRSFENGKYKCFSPYYFLIPELRMQLSHVCKEYLDANLFILDEFQRFSQLIKTEHTANKGEEIARCIFAKPDARVLLLSATPFKAYTNNFDEMQGEHHYSEFKSVLKFINIDESESFWEKLDTENHLFFDSIRNFSAKADNIEHILLNKQYIEDTYSKCIARTERVIVENTHNLSDKQDKQIEEDLKINKEDINDYIAIDKIIIANNEESEKKLPEAVEYVKSAPFPLSFLQDYDHHKVLEATYQKSKIIRKIINESSKAFLPIERISQYKALLPEKTNEPNPKLRLLYDKTVRNNGYKLLWIPPSINYYNPRTGVFRNAGDFSKTLIFSSWKLVPRMASALVSYEAERLSIGRYYEKESKNISYFVKEKGKEKRQPSPLLTFKYSAEKELSGMNNYMLIYPSIYLSSLYNPKQNLIENKKLSDIRKSLKSRIKKDLKDAGALTMGNTGGDWRKWYWYSVLLLDKTINGTIEFENWLRNINDIIENESDDEKEIKENKTAREKHLQEIKDIILNNETPLLGKLTSKQLEKISIFLTDLCLGAPGIVAYRSLKAVYEKNTNLNDLLNGAITIADGFISLFNKPESIAVVKTSTNEDFYYENVLTYCIDGNIQSMFDEYIYQLYDSAGYKDAFKTADFIKNILKINPGSVDVITKNSLKKRKRTILRTHYAVPFGAGSGNDLKVGKRQIKVREAFNSPFRPFVLTSTSIGQEGLDFHFYCSKIIHWNLPANPIDLEQREGRIKRYKSLQIRRNIAKKYANQIKSDDLENNLWECIFEYAKHEKENNDNPCDLIPYWYIDGEKGQIESIIPIYPFSKDTNKYHYIKNVLANYRLTFGQPRQEELVFALQHLTAKEQELAKKLLLNLSPIIKKKKASS